MAKFVSRRKLGTCNTSYELIEEGVRLRQRTLTSINENFIEYDRIGHNPSIYSSHSLWFIIFGLFFAGLSILTATASDSELGDLRRFSNPRKLMAFLGLVPSEESSGGKRRQGSITKCGNGHARWMLIECAQHYRKKPKVGAALSKRQAGLRQDVKDLSWRAQNRLSARYVKLRMRKKRETKIIVAIARELVGFLWELQNKCKLPIPQYQEEVLVSS